MLTGQTMPATELGMLIDMKFHIGIGCGHIDIESFYRFRKNLIALEFN
jgi:hypothetical protein